MYTFTKEFQTGVKAVVSNELKALEASNDLEKAGTNLVSVITSEFILLKKQVVASPDSKLSSSEQKLREAKKALKAYEANSSYYTKCLEIAYKLMVLKYDFVDFKSHSVSDLDKVVTLKPSKASLKKDFGATLKTALKAKATKEANESLKSLEADASLSNIVKGLSSEQLLVLKAYLNKSITAKA